MSTLEIELLAEVRLTKEAHGPMTKAIILKVNEPKDEKLYKIVTMVYTMTVRILTNRMVS